MACPPLLTVGRFSWALFSQDVSFTYFSSWLLILLPHAVLHFCDDLRSSITGIFLWPFVSFHIMINILLNLPLYHNRWPVFKIHFMKSLRMSYNVFWSHSPLLILFTPPRSTQFPTWPYFLLLITSCVQFLLLMYL